MMSWSYRLAQKYLWAKSLVFHFLCHPESWIGCKPQRRSQRWHRSPGLWCGSLRRSPPWRSCWRCRKPWRCRDTRRWGRQTWRPRCRWRRSSSEQLDNLLRSGRKVQFVTRRQPSTTSIRKSGSRRACPWRPRRANFSTRAACPWCSSPSSCRRSWWRERGRRKWSSKRCWRHPCCQMAYSFFARNQALTYFLTCTFLTSK